MTDCTLIPTPTCSGSETSARRRGLGDDATDAGAPPPVIAGSSRPIGRRSENPCVRSSRKRPLLCIFALPNDEAARRVPYSSGQRIHTLPDPRRAVRTERMAGSAVRVAALAGTDQRRPAAMPDRSRRRRQDGRRRDGRLRLASADRALSHQPAGADHRAAVRTLPPPPRDAAVAASATHSGRTGRTHAGRSPGTRVPPPPERRPRADGSDRRLHRNAAWALPVPTGRRGSRPAAPVRAALRLYVAPVRPAPPKRLRPAAGSRHAGPCSRPSSASSACRCGRSATRCASSAC